jgi:hypothetical protein
MTFSKKSLQKKRNKALKKREKESTKNMIRYTKRKLCSAFENETVNWVKIDLDSYALWSNDTASDKELYGIFEKKIIPLLKKEGFEVEDDSHPLRQPFRFLITWEDK